MVTTSLIAQKVTDLCEGMWVLVNYHCQDNVGDNSGKYFIGKVIKITSDPAGANVRYLEEEFGIGNLQRLEKWAADISSHDISSLDISSQPLRHSDNSSRDTSSQ